MGIRNGREALGAVEAKHVHVRLTVALLGKSIDTGMMSNRGDDSPGCADDTFV